MLRSSGGTISAKMGLLHAGAAAAIHSPMRNSTPAYSAVTHTEVPSSGNACKQQTRTWLAASGLSLHPPDALHMWHLMGNVGPGCDSSPHRKTPDNVMLMSADCWVQAYLEQKN